MVGFRKSRHLLGLRRACHLFLLCAAALFLAACQTAIPPLETPTPASVVVETPSPTETTPQNPEESRPASAGLIQLMDPLDEPEFYCVDVPGFGRSLNLQGALTAHTCKPGADDELFLWNAPAPGQISMPAYNLCMEAGGEEAGATLHLAECSDARIQQFRYDDDGQIRLDRDSAEGELCLTVGAEAGEPTGGPSHLRRGLSIEPCDQVDTARQLWTIGSPTVVKVESAND